MDEIERLKQRVGMTLGGKWTLERLLGYGGMAAVYVAVHKIGRRAAIKILHPEVAANKEIARRFEQEAHAVNHFQHPGSVEILDIDVTADGAPFLVMELLEGESLADMVDASKVDTTQMLRLIDELLDVLAAAHANRIIHRDIKPDNLFVLRDGRLKVLDFGIAQMRHGAPKTIYTAVGMTIGTLTYMSPEQVAGKEIDGRADLFAVGCTMFRIVSGRSPHEGDTELELMVKMAMEPAPPLASVAPNAPPDLCAVVDRALAFDRDRRYPDALTMQQDVRALREQRPPPFVSAALAPVAGAAVAAAAGAAVGGAALTAARAPVTMAGGAYPIGLAATMYDPALPSPAPAPTPTPSSATPAIAVVTTADARAKEKEKEKWVLFIMAGAIVVALLIGLVQLVFRKSGSSSSALMSESAANSAAREDTKPPGAESARPSEGAGKGRAGKGGKHGKKGKDGPRMYVQNPDGTWEEKPLPEGMEVDE